jgi:murein L,D-transpeptidase YcbB/YkuD
MNKLSTYVFILFAFAMVVACSGKKESTEAVANNEEWPEMDEFHMVMAESFHPFKDSANLEPAKANAAEMARVAEKWLNAPLPEKVNNDEIKASLAQLKTDAAAFTQIVQSSDTTKIGESLTSLHDLFHKLQEAWYGEGKGHGEHH